MQHDGEARNLLLTGPPGCGKTTVVDRVVGRIGDRPVRGFVTREIREAGARKGFVIETLDGRSALMAHVDIRSGARVGRYGVDLSALDRMVEQALAPGGPGTIHVIDEIGKMECLSVAFREAAGRLLEAEHIVLATIAMRGGGFIERARSLSGTRIWPVTAQDRDELPGRVLGWLDSRHPPQAVSRGTQAR